MSSFQRLTRVLPLLLLIIIAQKATAFIPLPPPLSPRASIVPNLRHALDENKFSSSSQLKLYRDDDPGPGGGGSGSNDDEKKGLLPPVRQKVRSLNT